MRPDLVVLPPELFDHDLRINPSDASRNIDRQTLALELSDDGQALQLLSVGAAKRLAISEALATRDVGPIVVSRHIIHSHGRHRSARDIGSRLSGATMSSMLAPCPFRTSISGGGTASTAECSYSPGKMIKRRCACIRFSRRSSNESNSDGSKALAHAMTNSTRHKIINHSLIGPPLI